MKYGRKWHNIGSDVNWQDYGGLWARRVDAVRWQVLEFLNTSDWGEDPGYRYHVDLSEVRLDSPQLAAALECCDSEPDCETLERVYALARYGAKAPLWQQGGNNSERLVREAKAEARRLRVDAQAYEMTMDRPVNKIGSTAREYQAGDIDSAILRGLADGRKDAEILAKMGMLRGH